MSGYRGLHGCRVGLLLAVVPVQVRTMLFTFKSMPCLLYHGYGLFYCNALNRELELVSVSMYILG